MCECGKMESIKEKLLLIYEEICHLGIYINIDGEEDSVGDHLAQIIELLEEQTCG